jgi:hypothetical protein
MKGVQYQADFAIQNPTTEVGFMNLVPGVFF